MQLIKCSYQDRVKSPKFSDQFTKIVEHSRKGFEDFPAKAAWLHSFLLPYTFAAMLRTLTESSTVRAVM